MYSFGKTVKSWKLCCNEFINSLRPSDAIWRQWSWTTLAQVMACCLTAPSHYLNQCWLIIRGVLWHTSESSFAGIAQGIDSGYEFEKDILKNIFKSPRGQWVNERSCHDMDTCSALCRAWMISCLLAFEHTTQRPVKWDDLISMWYHCNVLFHQYPQSWLNILCIQLISSKNVQSFLNSNTK